MTTTNSKITRRLKKAISLFVVLPISFLPPAAMAEGQVGKWKDHARVPARLTSKRMERNGPTKPTLPARVPSLRKGD